MKLIDNKKATENWVMDTMPYFILFVIVLGVSVVIFLIILSYFASKNTSYSLTNDFIGAQTKIFLDRFCKKMA